MALNSPTKLFSEGSTSKVVVYRYINVTAADTFNLSADFTKVSNATMLGALGTIQNPAVSALTTLTVGGGPSNEDGYLVAQGVSA